MREVAIDFANLNVSISIFHSICPCLRQRQRFTLLDFRPSYTSYYPYDIYEYKRTRVQTPSTMAHGMVWCDIYINMSPSFVAYCPVPGTHYKYEHE